MNNLLLDTCRSALLGSLLLVSLPASAQSDTVPPAADAQTTSEPAQSPPVPAAEPGSGPALPATGADANGQQPAVAAAERQSGTPEAPLPATERRQLPDYDGREAPATTASDVLIWAPRILFSPLYLVSEYVLRRPIGWAIITAEREKVATFLTELFTFGPEKNVGILPTGMIDFGFRPSIGLYFFANHLGTRDNKLRLRAAWGGPNWLLFNGSDTIATGNRQVFGIYGQYQQRPDWVFHGIGPDSRQDDLSRFESRELTGFFRYEARFGANSRLTLSSGVRAMDFKPDSGCCDDPTIADRVAQGRFPEPEGLPGYTIAKQGIDLSLDSRPDRRGAVSHLKDEFIMPAGSGVRLALRAEHNGSFQPERPRAGAPEERYAWIKYGATLGGYLDVSGQQRVVGLSLITDFAEPLGTSDTIPFFELVSLGGERPMRGFLEQQLLGRSSAVAQLDYQWPVWVWLDGTIHYAVGNVFGSQLDGFEVERLRSSFGIGIRASNAREHAFEFLVAAGTETFEDGGRIDNFRLVIGAPSGF
jgi:hypothetical protein